MSNLPKHIYQAIVNNHTSLGDHPAFPPEDEDKFLTHLLSRKYEQLKQQIGIDTPEELKSKLNAALTQCRNIEKENREALERACMSVLTKMFDIPQETIDINLKLVDKVDSSNQRQLPEKTEDFTFDDMDDAKSLTDDIYKRRFLNALISGAAIYYSTKVSSYISDVFDINEELPSLYKKILLYNNLLLFFEKDTLSNENTTEGGKVDVMLGNSTTMTRVEAEGIIFPILLEEAIKGLFEIAISHGLPQSREKAAYVTKKADFKLAELWDMRLGIPLWERIINQIDDEEIEPNFLLMELAELPVDDFNRYMQEILAKTKKGQSLLNDIVEEIKYKMEQDDFDDYVRTQNAKYPIDDQIYLSSSELIAEIDDDGI